MTERKTAYKKGEIRLRPVRMSKDLLMSIHRWLKENRIDEIWFETVGDNHLNVSLIKKFDGELPLDKSVLIDVMNFPDSTHPYFEYKAAEMNRDTKNTCMENAGYKLVDRKIHLL